MTAGVVAVLAIGVLMYRSYRQVEFASKLSSFQLIITRQGMPGESIPITTIGADGSIARAQESNGIRSTLAQSTLSADAMVEIRRSIQGLWDMQGDYEPALWRRTTAANFLSIELKLSDGSSRSIWLSNVNPHPTQSLLETINSVVPEEYYVRFISR